MRDVKAESLGQRSGQMLVGTGYDAVGLPFRPAEPEPRPVIPLDMQDVSVRSRDPRAHAPEYFASAVALDENRQRSAPALEADRSRAPRGGELGRGGGPHLPLDDRLELRGVVRLRDVLDLDHRRLDVCVAHVHLQGVGPPRL